MSNLDSSLRLYFESIVRLANGTNPSTLADDELVALVGLLPVPAVNYSDWRQKIGLDSESNNPITEEEAIRINDAAVRTRKLMEMQNNVSQPDAE